MTMRRPGMQQALFFAILAALGVLTMGAQPASARGFVRLSFGVPVYGPAYPPGVVYAYPPPVAYSPPVVLYGPPAVYAPPSPQLSSVPPADTPRVEGECREYRTTAAIGPQLQQVSGTACRQPDGTWRIIR